jgi:hypothetical protein
VAGDGGDRDGGGAFEGVRLHWSDIGGARGLP